MLAIINTINEIERFNRVRLYFGTRQKDASAAVRRRQYTAGSDCARSAIHKASVTASGVSTILSPKI